ncbi:MAG TPA: alpha/beta hydrolase-fold protein [Terriglobia bacterium]|nr:alpha/beta hydrolase-fold protein [Terriglobia bacterium]
MKRRPWLLPIFIAVMAVSGWAQSPPAAAPAARPPQPQPPPPIVSPEVHADRTVTFRFRDPNAKEVMLALEGTKPQPMQKDDQGVWSITTAPLDPDYYGYSFVADGVNLVDPSNSLMKTNLLFQSNMVHVPGAPPEVWDTTDVPHGLVHHHFYHSAVVGDDRDYFVYTPPGYDPTSDKRYPVLYLLHGYSDGADGWTAVGRANFILDNLIAQGKAKPMIVVMPLGYGAPEILHRGSGSFRDAGLVRRNMDKFGEALLTEVTPQVEQAYHVISDRNARAIVGLSMGGAESLYVGLNHLDHFAWVGSFSAGGLAEDYNVEFASLDSKANDQLHVLWIACGTEDHLIEPNRKFREWLTSKGVKHIDIETPGMHTWMVWRRNLANFAPLLFQSEGSTQ